MNLKELKNTQELQTFLDGSQAVAFSVSGNKAARYSFIQSMMCQHFSGHKLTQLFAEFHNLRVINSYSQNEFFLYYRILQYIQILPV